MRSFPSNLLIDSRLIFIVLLFTTGVFIHNRLLTMEKKRSIINVENTRATHFVIHILTWNRPDSFKRLVSSIKQSHYGIDHVDLIIHVDGGYQNKDTKDVANSIKWPFGNKKVFFSNDRKGLAQAWFSAWFPSDNKTFAIIFEDDIVVSPLWYQWLTCAWKKYRDRDDIAGISLQRQRLIPYKPAKIKEIINNHEPFLFPLVGSIGFSPHPIRWKQFLLWIQTFKMDNFDIDIPYLITSETFKKGKKGHMWTQHFIFFCNKYNLFTLYINLPGKVTLAAHMREKGQHSKKTAGQDLPIAFNVSMHFPSHLSKYNWAGQPISNFK